MKIAPDPSRVAFRGFTLVELMVVVAVIAVLAALLLPALALAKGKARMVECLGNKRQIAIAMSAYTSDNGDRIVNNGLDHLNPTTLQEDPNNANLKIKGLAPTWCTGVVRWFTWSSITNTRAVADPNIATLAAYVGLQGKIYRCPSDNYLSGEQRAAGWTARVRSVSMNWYVGDGWLGGGGGAPIDKKTYDRYNTYYVKDSDFRQQSPAMVWSVMDVHPDSVGPCFAYNTFVEDEWVINSLPGGMHAGSGTLAFCDGHAEGRQWVPEVGRAPIRYLDVQPARVSDTRDIVWLRERSTTPVSGQPWPSLR